jgi:hypothetical protein
LCVCVCVCVCPHPTPRAYRGRSGRGARGVRGLRKCLAVDLVEVPQHCHAVPPRVLEVHPGLAVASNNQLEALSVYVCVCV